MVRRAAGAAGSPGPGGQRRRQRRHLRPALEAVAPLLEYPDGRLRRRAARAARLVVSLDGEAARCLEAFAAAVRDASPAALEERYTATFDLQPRCTPYVGYQLFGDSYARGSFLAYLAGRYREQGFACVGELPDHVAVVLRFLARHPDALPPEFLPEALAPAVEKMHRSLAGGDNPYRLVLDALRRLIHAETGVGADPGAEPVNGVAAAGSRWAGPNPRPGPAPAG